MTHLFIKLTDFGVWNRALQNRIRPVCGRISPDFARNSPATSPKVDRRAPNPPTANPLAAERTFPTSDYWGRPGVARCTKKWCRDFQQAADSLVTQDCEDIQGALSATSPEGPARHLDVSGQKLSPHCLETIFDSQLPSPKSSPKMPPKLSLPHTKGHFFFFQNYSCGEGNCKAIERQKLSRGKSRCLAGPTGRGLATTGVRHFPKVVSLWKSFHLRGIQGFPESSRTSLEVPWTSPEVHPSLSEAWHDTLWWLLKRGPGPLGHGGQKVRKQSQSP